MTNTLDLQVIERDGRTCLGSPEVGTFTRALPRGALVAEGEHAGTIVALGRAYELRVPPGVVGLVVNAPPAALRHPVGYGDVLYELAPAADAERVAAKSAAATSALPSATGRGVLAPSSGRFYHRPAPGEPAFVVAGDVVREGTPVGLVEVMKTFSHVTYRPTGGLPPIARVLRFVAADGADVRAGELLVEVERAEG